MTHEELYKLGAGYADRLDDFPPMERLAVVVGIADVVLRGMPDGLRTQAIEFLGKCRWSMVP
jgi:hypothetical protein